MFSMIQTAARASNLSRPFPPNFHQKMDQDKLHKLAGVFTVGGGLCIASGILLFSPELLYGGACIVIGGAMITLCALEKQRTY